ncbi:arylamine N-acetyltransferase family protein [Corynebacterium sp. A21]|uniref:arylamine N-acetyltransferase family protein n=1 Tax=Corynebacterium sp. A21 TaxID=3457318 RepID=UPI003FD3A50C
MSLLERYFTRLGMPAPVPGAAQAELLDDLLAHHAGVIPFENLDPLLGRGVSLDPDDISAKLLDAARGGYCHEHALLSQRVLRELGFHSFGILARVYQDPALTTPSGKTHHATLVVVDGGLRLFDPGFGGGTPTATLPVEVGAQVGEFRIVAASEVLAVCMQAHDVSLMLQRRSGAGVWHNVYGFDPVAAQPQDIEISNWFVSTNPQVMFTQFPVLARPTREGTRYSLNRRSLRTVGPSSAGISGETVEEITDSGRFGEVLRQTFGLQLNEKDMMAVWELSATQSG